jgi:hypothetical protein
MPQERDANDAQQNNPARNAPILGRIEVETL